MQLSCGIVGLPNVGKSTLFNALLKKQVANVANYPFCTIEPNKGVVEVPDSRLPVLATIVATEKIIPAVVEFYDIAGLVKGASKGEGLGNQFLANIREVSVIVHVIRFFDDPNVVHVDNKIDPASDIETINSELILADLQTLEKQREPKMNAEKVETTLWEAVGILKKEMDNGILARNVKLTDEHREEVRKLCLLTDKPVIYVANISEEQLTKIACTSPDLRHAELVSASNEIPKQVRDDDSDHCVNILSNFPYKPIITLSAKMESELAALSGDDAKEYLSQYNLAEPGLDRLIKLAYETLGLASFLTAGIKEVRAWTIKQGMTAKEAAGVIHTDFEKGFIKADVVPFEDFVQNNGWVNSRAQGKVRSEGKEYVIKDGEIVEFKVNA